MSVVMQRENTEEIVMYTKGADNMIFDKIKGKIKINLRVPVALVLSTTAYAPDLTVGALKQFKLDQVWCCC